MGYMAAGLFQGFWGKRPLPKLGIFYVVYIVFYTGYIHKFMECCFHRSLVTSKQTIWNLISLLIIWFLVYLFLCYRQKVFLLKWDFFLEIGNIFLEIGKNGPYLALGMGPNIGPRETR